MNLICVNQTIALKFSLTVSQAAFYTHFRNYCLIPDIVIDDKEYHLITREFVINTLPLFFVKQDSVYRAFKTLDKKGLIQYINIDNKDYIRFLELNIELNINFKKINKEPLYCYLMIDHNTGYYKIGKSKSPKFRETTLQSQKPTIELIHIWEKDFSEKQLHEKFSNKRIRGEWFNLTSEDVKFLKYLK
jgi:hypothetical protein